MTKHNKPENSSSPQQADDPMLAGEAQEELPRAHTKLHDQLMRKWVETTPMGQSITFDISQLPDIVPPSLDDIHVKVPLPQPFSEEELMERFYQLCFDQAPAVARQVGEPVEEHDRIWVDVIGFANGKILPFSIRSQMEMLIGVDTFLQGFNAQLVGNKVGDNVIVQVQLPDDYPAINLRGANAAFTIDILHAEVLSLPDPNNDDELKVLGYGDNLEAILTRLVDEIHAERTQELLDQGDRMALELVTHRTFVPVPDELIDEEIRRRWLEREGPFLSRREFPVAEQQEALEGWLNEPGLRAETQKNLQISLALRAIAQRDGLEIDPKEIDAFVDDLAESLDVSAYELKASLKSDDASRDRIVSQYIHLKAVNHVLSHATIQFEGAEDA